MRNIPVISPKWRYQHLQKDGDTPTRKGKPSRAEEHNIVQCDWSSMQTHDMLSFHPKAIWEVAHLQLWRDVQVTCCTNKRLVTETFAICQKRAVTPQRIRCPTKRSGYCLRVFHLLCILMSEFSPTKSRQLGPSNCRSNQPWQTEIRASPDPSSVDVPSVNLPCIIFPANFPLNLFPCIVSPVSFLLHQFPLCHSPVSVYPVSISLASFPLSGCSLHPFPCILSPASFPLRVSVFPAQFPLRQFTCVVFPVSFLLHQFPLCQSPLRHSPCILSPASFPLCWFPQRQSPPCQFPLCWFPLCHFPCVSFPFKFLLHYYGSILTQLYPPYVTQILGFWVTCAGVKMMSLHHDWGCQPPQTASPIHIRH